MRLLTLIVAMLWIGAVAWFGWTSLPQLPLDVSSKDAATIEALNGARLQHAAVFFAIGLIPASLIVWLGRRFSR